MPASPVPYDIFTAANGGRGFVNENGYWYYDRSSYDVNIGSQAGGWCGDVPYCITGWMYPSASLSYYSVSFYANISVDLQQYPNANSLSCTFSYKPLWISTKTAAGTPIPLKIVVGSQTFTDSLPAGNFDRVFTTNQWEGDTYSHNADIPLSRSNAATVVYIPLFINITWPRQTADYINYYVKSTTFTINTQRTENFTTSTTPASASASATQGPIPIQRGNRTATIVAATLGALVLLGLVGICFLWFKMRRRRAASEERSRPPHSGIFKAPPDTTYLTDASDVTSQRPNAHPVAYPDPRTDAQSYALGHISSQTYPNAPYYSHGTSILSSLRDSNSQYHPSSIDYPYQISVTTSSETRRKEFELPPYTR